MNNNKFVTLGGLKGLMEETCLPLAWLKKMTLSNDIPSIKIENKYYYHVPIIFIIPSIYAGYHTFKNRNAIVNWLI